MLGELFQDPETEKLQLKAVTLLHDIIVERVGLLLYSTNNLSRVMRKPMFWVLTRSDTNQAMQSQKMARGLKFRI